jgi:hypothetical protein
VCVVLAAIPAWVQLGLAAASIAAQHAAGVRSAEKQAGAIRKAEDLQQQDLRRQQQQQMEQAAGAINAEARQAVRDRALFDTMEGEYGGGNSIDRNRVVGDVYSSEQLATLQSNAQIAQGETAFRSFASSERSQSQINGIDAPSIFGTALKLGGAYVNYATAMSDTWRAEREQRERDEREMSRARSNFRRMELEDQKNIH